MADTTIKYVIKKGLLTDIANADDGRKNFSATYIEVFVESTGAVRHIWGIYHSSIGRNERTEYHDKSILRVGLYQGHVTRKQLVTDAMQTVASYEYENEAR